MNTKDSILIQFKEEVGLLKKKLLFQIRDSVDSIMNKYNLKLDKKEFDEAIARNLSFVWNAGSYTLKYNGSMHSIFLRLDLYADKLFVDLYKGTSWRKSIEVKTINELLDAIYTLMNSVKDPIPKGIKTKVKKASSLKELVDILEGLKQDISA